MPDPQTANLGLYIPLNGADVGSWDVPMNANWNTLDSVLGGASSVTLSNVSFALSPAQYNVGMITFTGTITANIQVIFPAIGRTYIVRNNCTGNTSFYVLCIISALSRWVALPPNETVMIASDGSNIDFVGLERVGTYLDFSGSSVPIWVLYSNPAPYLNCDGSIFSATDYPALAAYLGGTTLPDARGRFRATLNQATGRLSGVSGTNGINADTLLATGGNQTIGQTNIPNYALTVTVTDPGHVHSFQQGQFSGSPLASIQEADTGYWNQNFATATGSAVTGISVSVNTGGSGSGYAPPAYVGGLTLIRAG